MESQFKIEEIEDLGFIYFKYMNGYHAYSKLSDKVRHIESGTPAKIQLMTDMEQGLMDFTLNGNVQIYLTSNVKDPMKNAESGRIIFRGTLNSVDEIEVILKRLGV